jgi:hypothetical protein
VSTPPPLTVDGWLVDASIALKWFLPIDREPDGYLARALIGSLAMRTTSLAFYEVGNILTRRSACWKTFAATRSS